MILNDIAYDYEWASMNKIVLHVVYCVVYYVMHSSKISLRTLFHHRGEC